MIRNKSLMATSAILTIMAALLFPTISANAAETDAIGARAVLAASSYTKIQVAEALPKLASSNFQTQACPQGLDIFKTEFMASSPAGYSVGGFVCSATRGGGLVIVQVVKKQGSEILVQTDPTPSTPAK